MKKAEMELVVAILLGLFVLFFGALFIGYNDGVGAGYKRGQVDCLNGKVKYELKTNEDKSVEWVEKEER